MSRVITMNCEMPSLGETLNTMEGQKALNHIHPAECGCAGCRPLAAEDYVKALVYPLAIEPLPKYERPAPFTEVPPSRPTDAIDDGHGPLVQVLMKQVRDLEQQNSWLQQSNNQLLERARRAEALNREYQRA